jgi:type IV pilus assembly protein PilA
LTHLLHRSGRTSPKRLAPVPTQRRQRSTDESGYTLIELLAVILIIGILAAIAIPAFLNQKSKAVDAQAKELARTAETTAETIGTENSGNYEKVTSTELHAVEPAIRIAPTTTEAYLSSVTSSKTEYSVTAKAVGGDELTISKSATGTVTRTCVSPVTKTGCSGGPTASW